jgi:uncharacterized membrane protein YeaQ/YmgE (transglycosylase-associated protein family)
MNGWHLPAVTLGSGWPTNCKGAGMTILAWIILGLAAGYLGSKIVNHTGSGVLRDVVLGIVGAVVGGYGFQLVGLRGVTGLNLWGLVVAVVGAVLTLIASHVITRRPAQARDSHVH